MHDKRCWDFGDYKVTIEYTEEERSNTILFDIVISKRGKCVANLYAITNGTGVVKICSNESSVMVPLKVVDYISIALNNVLCKDNQYPVQSNM